jgi:hypothetical protein
VAKVCNTEAVWTGSMINLDLNIIPFNGKRLLLLLRRKHPGGAPQPQGGSRYGIEGNKRMSKIENLNWYPLKNYTSEA